MRRKGKIYVINYRLKAKFYKITFLYVLPFKSSIVYHQIFCKQRIELISFSIFFSYKIVSFHMYIILVSFLWRMHESENSLERLNMKRPRTKYGEDKKWLNNYSRVSLITEVNNKLGHNY